MPICIECSYPVSHLYSTYSRADDRALGKGVRLTQCPRCQRFADKYVEYDFVVLFIDLVLIKPQVYRHLLFNRLGRDDNQFDHSILRLGILLLLFDVYLTWARIEKSQSVTASPLARAPIIIQYFFFLSLNALATLAHHLTVRLSASVLAPNPRGGPATTTAPSHPTSPVFPSFPQSSNPASPSRLSPHPYNNDTNPSANGGPPPPMNGENSHHSATAQNHAPPPPPSSPPPPPLRRTPTGPVQTVQPLPPPSPASPNAVSTALLVSSCAKLFPILLVIWGPDGSGSAPTEPHAPGSRETISPAQTLLVQHALNGITPVATTARPTSPAARATESVVETWATKLASSVPESTPTNVVAWLFGVLGSLLSLGAADTHLVLLSNVEALYILLGCGYFRAVALAVAGHAARWTVQRVVLGAVGLVG
ncbi:intracellular lipid transport [Aspergillus sp. HF37]|nr:intracellular lipid transport [Aspergillus sp. HF37]